MTPKLLKIGVGRNWYRREPVRDEDVAAGTYDTVILPEGAQDE